MTDVLIADLAQISSLRVISRTSVMQLKGTKKTLTEIARQLNVDGVIEGSVLRSGDQVRITAELVDTSTDRHLWARTYDRKVGDVLTLQSEVARAIAGEIQARITPQESGRLSRNRTVSPAALEAYLKGRFYWGQFTEESLTKSIEFYEQATSIDPAYAAAYAGLSESWTGLGWIGARPWQEVRTMAKDAAMKALAIDDALSDAHAAVAVALPSRLGLEDGRRQRTRRRSHSIPVTRPPICPIAISCATSAAGREYRRGQARRRTGPACRTHQRSPGRMPT